MSIGAHSFAVKRGYEDSFANRFLDAPKFHNGIWDTMMVLQFIVA